MGLNTLAKSLIPQKYHWQINNKLRSLSHWRARSYSSFGEDLVVGQLLGHKRRGFYVDVGAFHPFKYSNTHLFHHHFGWQGINVEPNPENIKLFRRHRSQDINLNLGVGEASEALEYFQFLDPLYNTFSGEQKEATLQKGVPLTGSKTVEVKPLGLILSEHAPGQAIDFLNIDVENKDLEVLMSMDWSDGPHPQVIAIEDHSMRLGSPQSSKIFCYLQERDYELKSHCHFTSIYLKRPVGQ